MSRMALVYGVYDLTHYGHYRLFKKLYDEGYDVWVGVVSDDFVKSYKRTPKLNEEERVENVSHCKWVSRAFLSSNDFPEELMRYHPDVIAHGSDWSDEAYMKHMGYTKDMLEYYNTELITLPYTEGVSTTELIEKIKSEDR